MNGLVSIIIPVYNMEEYLDRLFVSLLNQTYQEYELIVINDGSVDDSQKIIDSYKEHFGEKLKYYCQDNKGLSATRNKGLEVASGDYIVFIDSDDYVKDTYIQKMIDNIANVDIVICGISYYDGENFFKHVKVEKDMIESGIDLAKDSLRRRRGAHVLWNKMYRKEVIKDFRFVNNRLHEDMLGCAIIPCDARRVKYISDELYVYCIRDNSISSKMNSKNVRDLIDNIADIIEFYKNIEMLECMKEDIGICLMDLFVQITKMYTDNTISENELRGNMNNLLTIRKRFLNDLSYSYVNKQKD